MNWINKGYWQSQSQLLKDREQPGKMGVTATPKYKESACWTHRERMGFRGSDQKRFDQHTFYFGYNVTNAFYSALKAAKGVCPKSSCNYIP